MSEKRIGVGVVGIGWVAHPHIDAWLKNGNCDVVALCSRDMDHFVDCILHDKTPMPDIKDAVKTHEICFAAEQSALERKPITLPLA